jgi:hypothetical protein
MKAFVALMFCKQQDLRSYAPEVLAAVKRVAGDNFKYGEAAAGVVAIAFRSDEETGFIVRVFRDLWRPEQRTWVLPLDEPPPVLIDNALMAWARKSA